MGTELAFKRSLRSSATGATEVAFSFMNLFIYSDESGVFDKKHNDYFIFGGVIFFGSNQKEKAARRYRSIERQLKSSLNMKSDYEMKACRVSNKIKMKLYKCMNNFYKFCVLIKQQNVLDSIFDNPKHKQRYLDYAYKMCLKKSLQYLVKKQLLNPYIIENIYVYADEHHTATDGLYELKENLLNEFKYGTFNDSWSVCYEALFPSIQNVFVYFCDSSKTTLVRSADIIANHFYHLAIENKGELSVRDNCFIFELPLLKIISTGENFFANRIY